MRFGAGWRPILICIFELASCPTNEALDGLDFNRQFLCRLQCRKMHLLGTSGDLGVVSLELLAGSVDIVQVALTVGKTSV